MENGDEGERSSRAPWGGGRREVGIQEKGIEAEKMDLAWD